jgi:hypothetical protein
MAQVLPAASLSVEMPDHRSHVLRRTMVIGLTVLAAE